MEFKLIIKKLNNTLSQSEKAIFEAWYNERLEHQNYFNNVKENYANNIDHIDVEKGWQRISSKIVTPKKQKGYWKYAAAILIFVSTGYFFLSKDTNMVTEPPVPAIVNETIEVGTDKATLTLEDGTTITLEEGQTYQAAHINSNGKDLVYKAKENNDKEVQYNYLTIPRGGQFFVKLADGTQVWLNSESQLKYPVNFISGQTREVELVYGEAYFDVSHSTHHNGDKFKVINQNQNVEVLGTEFNIKAYKDESHIYTTLVHGKVVVSNAYNKQGLTPNQQSKINLKNNKMTVNTVDVYGEISWKKGLFSFKSKPLKEIMVVLSRWYDVDVTFQNKDLESVKFNGVISKNEKIEDLLDIIKNTNFINAYEITAKKITIK